MKKLGVYSSSSTFDSKSAPGRKRNTEKPVDCIRDHKKYIDKFKNEKAHLRLLGVPTRVVHGEPYMASARLRHEAACPVSMAFIAGAGHSAAARS